jgi:hypothetical protein
MNKWYLVGSLGGMKMLYYVGAFETEEQANEQAIMRYKVKKKDIPFIILESKEGE